LTESVVDTLMPIGAKTLAGDGLCVPERLRDGVAWMATGACRADNNVRAPTWIELQLTHKHMLVVQHGVL
jgi:hypothetical protein